MITKPLIFIDKSNGVSEGHYSAGVITVSCLHSVYVECIKINDLVLTDTMYSNSDINSYTFDIPTQCNGDFFEVVAKSKGQEFIYKVKL